MIKARFRTRKNRFTAVVDLAGEDVLAHVANSGRLKELFQPGAEVYLIDKRLPHRTTAYDLALVKYDGVLVSVDARVPNRVVRDAINKGLLPEFSGFRVVRSEIPFGRSRLDLLLENKDAKRVLVEVKSVTLVNDGTARFPDAPTERGARHLGELVLAVQEGYRSAIVFLIQREDAVSFSPNDMTDPAFGQALRGAVRAGVEVYAYICRVTLEDVQITGSLPVNL